VPYAELGAQYVDGHTGEPMVMKAKNMRGVTSEGMVLSEKELGLGEDHEGILILDPKLTVGLPLADALGDPVLVLELQPNRPDCMGIVGIARELAAVQRVALREPAIAKLRYDLDPTTLRPRTVGGSYLDPEAAAAAIEAVKNQGR